MGSSGRFDADDWGSARATVAAKPAAAIFSTNLDPKMDPKLMKNGLRESCDSDINPNSTPIIIGLDVTGSMGQVPEAMIKDGLGKLFHEIYDKSPVSDPHVLFSAVGDYFCDRVPFQVGQFECDVASLVGDLARFYLEGGGGGNAHESYELPYYFAAYHTKIDSMLKRNKKGYIFTIGDELPVENISRDHIKQIFGSGPETDMSFGSLMNVVRQRWEPYHLVLTETNTARAYLPELKGRWADLLGEHVIMVDDYRKISEVITSILRINNGATVADVVSSWDGSTSMTVANAVSGLTVGRNTSDALVTF